MNTSTVSWHIEKHKRGGVTRMSKHNEREPGQNHSNPNIDPNRTASNINLKPSDKTYLQRIDEQLEARYKGKHVIKSNQVHLVTQTVQLGGLFKEEGDDDDYVEVLKNVAEWLEDRYGSDNVIGATIHLDETTPHLHFDVLPLTEDGRLSARDVFSRRALIETQNDLLNHLQQSYPEVNFQRQDPNDRMFKNGQSQKDFEKLADLQAENEKRAIELRTREVTANVMMHEAKRQKQQVEDDEKVLKEREKKLEGQERRLNEREESLNQKEQSYKQELEKGSNERLGALERELKSEYSQKVSRFVNEFRIKYDALVDSKYGDAVQKARHEGRRLPDAAIYEDDKKDFELLL